MDRLAPTASVLVLTGLRQEAHLLANAGTTVLVSGGRPDRLRRLLRARQENHNVVLSFGLCGGLATELRPGALLIPESILIEGTLVPTDVHLAAMARDWAHENGMVADPGPIAGRDQLVGTVAEKQALRGTGATAVDMESQVAAEFAAECGARLLVLRAVADPADRALPRLAAAALDDNGTVRIGPVAAGLLRRPTELPRLLAAGRDSAAALATLRRCRPLVELLLRLGAADFR